MTIILNHISAFYNITSQALLRLKAPDSVSETAYNIKLPESLQLVTQTSGWFIQPPRKGRSTHDRARILHFSPTASALFVRLQLL
jgi:hypothetical protein